MIIIADFLLMLSAAFEYASRASNWSERLRRTKARLIASWAPYICPRRFWTDMAVPVDAVEVKRLGNIVKLGDF